MERLRKREGIYRERDRERRKREREREREREERRETGKHLRQAETLLRLKQLFNIVIKKTNTKGRLHDIFTNEFKKY